MATEDFTTYTEYDPYSTITVAANEIIAVTDGDYSIREAGVHKTIPGVSALAASTSVVWDHHNPLTAPLRSIVCLVGFHNAPPVWWPVDAEWPMYSISLLHTGDQGPQGVYLGYGRALSHQIGEVGVEAGERANVRLAYANGLLTGELWTGVSGETYETHAIQQLDVPHVDISELWAARVIWYEETVGRMTVNIGPMALSTMASGQTDIIGDGQLDVTPKHRLHGRLDMIGDAMLVVGGAVTMPPTERRRRTDWGMAVGTNWV